MASLPADPQYKSENEADADHYETNETAQHSNSGTADDERNSSLASGVGGHQSTSGNTEKNNRCNQKQLEIKPETKKHGSEEKIASPSVEGLEHVGRPIPQPTSDTNLNSSAHANTTASHRDLTTSSSASTSPSASAVEELSSDQDTHAMPRYPLTSYPEDSVPSQPRELPATSTCHSNGDSSRHGHGAPAPVSNGAPSSTQPSRGLCLGSQTKQYRLDLASPSNGDTNNSSEKQKLVPAEIPGDSGQKRVRVDCEETRLLDCLPARDVSNVRTYMNLYKTLTGPSTVGMPRVIRNGGLLTGFVGFLFIGFLNAHCNITMVQCGRILERRTGKTWYSYEQIVEESLATYSDRPSWQKATCYGRRVALFMLVLCQLGLMSFYYQIIATTLQKELELLLGIPVGPLVLVEVCVCVCVLPYSWLRNLRLQAWFSTFANILNVVSIAIILQYAVRHMKPVSSVHLTPADPWTIPLFIGGAVFTVEGIAMILPIENRTRCPKDYTGPFGMVALATATNVLVNLATGFYGYLAFGDEASGNILVSLPNMWVYRLVSIMYAGMVFLTFNLQLYQPAEAIYAWLRQKVPQSEVVLKHGNVATRTVLTILTFLFAALVPRVDLMMSLIGAFCAGFLVFILPVICELFLLHSEPGGVTWAMWVKDILILLFGVTAFLTGTYTSVIDIVKALNLKQ